MGILSNLRDRAIASQDGKSGHGSWRAANSGIVEGKPWVQYWSNGLFEGEDGSLWKYYEAPKDVRIEWLKDPEEAISNQAFFVDVCARLGAALDAQTEKVRNDIRRAFHIQITQKPFDGIRPYPGCTPAHADYLSRIAEQYGKPVWHGFFGVQILPGSMFYEKHGFRDHVERYLELMRSPGGLQWDMYKADIDEVDAIMKENGFVEPDFSKPDDESFAQLTAWHGVEDRQYGLSRQLQTTRMQQPTHGLSMVVPKWGEIVFHAIKPSDETRLTDPLSEKSRWAKPLYSPSSDVVLINIRGEVRAPSIADNLLDLKRLKRTDDHGMVKDLDDLHLIDQISLARTSVKEVKLPMLDNTEIIVGSLLPQDKSSEPGIIKGVKRYGLQALPLVGRQHLGVLTSFPTYPRHVMRVPRGNAKRPELTNVMLPGILAFSGLWRNTGVCGPGGILMGLSDDLQFQEIYTEPDAAWKESRVPAMLITGRPGAGKALTLDTPIMTPDGPVLMGEIKIGDTVFGGDGKPCKVTFVTPIQHDRKLFKITLSDGQVITADEEHQWVIQTRSDRYYYKNRDAGHVTGLMDQTNRAEEKLLALAERFGDSDEISRAELTQLVVTELGDDAPWKSIAGVGTALKFTDCAFVRRDRGARYYPTRVALKSLAVRVRQMAAFGLDEGKPVRRMTTGEMFANGVTRVTSKGTVESKYNIPLAQPVQYPERDLLVDPYVLGAWLGDGSTGAGAIASGNIGLSVDPETGIGDMQYMLKELEGYNPHPKTSQSDCVLTNGLTPQLRELGILKAKRIPEDYMHASAEQRLALLQGLMDTDGYVLHNGGVGFSNTDEALVTQVTELVRSLGIKVHAHSTFDAVRGEAKKVVRGREVTPRQDTHVIGFSSPLPMFRLPRKLRKQKLDVGLRSTTNMIVAIEEIETAPVRCISVDSSDRTYLIHDGIVTSNTQQLLQTTVQMAYMGLPVFFFNPKKEGTLKNTFDHIGGATVSMDRKYLASNPGVLDPIHFIDDRSTVADILEDAIFSAAGLLGSEHSQVRARIMSEIHERAKDPRNNSSWDILFGNGSSTSGISSEELREFVKHRVQTSPVWRALISKTGEASDLKGKVASGKSVLIEWDKKMTLPDPKTPRAEYSDTQIDSLISVNVAFQYASAAVNGKGGAIIVDEAWVLKASHESMQILERGGREWRQANIMLVLGTQKILDFMGSGPDEVNMTTYFSRFLFMALQENDDLELDAFFKATGLPRDKATEHYILNAGRDTRRGVVRNPIPKAYYIDTLHMWHGGIICGPWPKLELNLGRTDKGGEEARRAMGIGGEEKLGSFRGELAGLAEEREQQDTEDPAEDGELVAG